MAQQQAPALRVRPVAPEITVRGDRTVPKITDREPPALAEQPPAVPVVRGEPAVQVAWVAPGRQAGMHQRGGMAPVAVQVAWGGMARPDVMVVTGR
ncbi:hypothetical protein DX198_23350 [Salmonella enterica]|nr:hypothetical protein [Salmonella enterica]EAN6633927.1 hypothetical protein [Salmonella enterica]EBJ6040967.1 hypothetical protein [Salmonella enterica]EBM3662012.1 hypothetical protein [Salmonella enterica]ECU9158888.1 hypothetical protein [Salmonella enterica]